MLKIAPDAHVLFRADWGARTDLPRLGVVLPPAVATEAIMHHTVIIDQDATPNRWENVTEVIQKMRRLQTIRPDLGLDVPYSYVAFLMRYNHKLGLILCEGRGPYRRGAHTKWHNVTGRAVAIEGNTEIGLPIDPYAEHLSYAWGWIKDEYGLVNLGNVTPGRGGIIYGHTDFRRDDDRSTWTACPGQGMMAVIDQLTLTRWEASVPEPEPRSEPEEEMDVELVRTPYVVDGQHKGWFVWATNWLTRHYVSNLATMKVFQDKGLWPKTIRDLGTRGAEFAIFKMLERGEDIPPPR